MALDSLTHGAQRQVLEYLDSETRKLVTILCLPLVDGVFATLLVSGAVQTFSDIVTVSLTIFTGAGALAILYSSTENSLEARKTVVKAAPLLILGAIAVSLVAPVYEQLVYVSRMETVAGLALLVIAAKMLELNVAEHLSVPAVIITGLVLSIKSPEAISFTYNYLAPALLTALTASAALYLASFLDRDRFNLLYIRRGAGLVLVVISLSLFGVETPSNLALLIFTASVAYSLEPFKDRSFPGIY